MRDLDAKSLLGEVNSRTEKGLETSERIARITVMTGFIVVLAAEAWLLWQVFQIF